MTYNQNLFPKTFSLDSSEDSDKDLNKKSKEDIELSQQISQANQDSLSYGIQEQNQNVTILKEYSGSPETKRSIERFEGDLSVDYNTIIHGGLEVENISRFNQGFVSKDIGIFQSGIISENYNRFSGYLELPYTEIISSLIEISPESIFTLHGVLTASSSSRIITEGKLESRYLQASKFVCLDEMDVQGNIHFENVDDSYFISDMRSTFNSDVRFRGEIEASGITEFSGSTFFSGIPVISGNMLILDSYNDESNFILSNQSFQMGSENNTRIKGINSAVIGLSPAVIDQDKLDEEGYNLMIDSRTGKRIINPPRSETRREDEAEFEYYLNQGLYVDVDLCHIQHRNIIYFSAPATEIEYQTNWGYASYFKSYPPTHLHAKSYTVPIFPKHDEYIQPYHKEYNTSKEIIGDVSRAGLSQIFTKQDYENRVEKNLVPIGTIISYAGFDRSKENSNIPSNWVLCNGRAYSTNNFPELGEVLGEKFNLGGESLPICRVPNLINKFIRGANPEAQSEEPTADGNQGGDDKVTLTHDKIPNHRHSINHTHSIGGSTLHNHRMDHGHNGSNTRHSHPMGHGHAINDPGHKHRFEGQDGEFIPYAITEYRIGQPGKGGGTWDDSAPDIEGVDRRNTGISVERYQGRTGESQAGSSINNFTGHTHQQDAQLNIWIGQPNNLETGSAGIEENPEIPTIPNYMALVYIIKVRHEDPDSLITENIPVV